MNAVVDRAVTDFARDELAGKLLKLCVTQLSGLETPWSMTSENRQEIVINAMAQAIKTAVNDAVATISSGCKPAVRGKLKTVTFDEGIKAVITIPGGSDGRLDLADAAGNEVLIIVTPYQDYTGGTQKVKPESDQRPLDLVEGEDPKGDDAPPPPEVKGPPPEYEVKDMGDGMFAVKKDGMPIPDAPLTFPSHEEAEDWLQQHLKLGKYAPKPEASAEGADPGAPDGDAPQDGDGQDNDPDAPAAEEKPAPSLDIGEAKERFYEAGRTCGADPNGDPGVVITMLDEYPEDFVSEHGEVLNEEFARGMEDATGG